PKLPATTVSEFITYGKANPGKINFASNGIGATGHLAGEMFKMLTGVELQHVPYRGESPALTDLIGGQVQVMVAALPGSLPVVRGGQLRARAVTASARWPGLPDVPTLSETVPGYELDTWAGMGAPKGTPGEIVERLNREINAGLATPEIRSKYAD